MILILAKAKRFLTRNLNKIHRIFFSQLAQCIQTNWKLRYLMRIEAIFEAAQKVPDLNRVTNSTGLPTRLHQQDRKLAEKYGRKNVKSKVVESGYKTTADAKMGENARLQKRFDKTNVVPEGNKKSFKPKKGCK